MFSSLFAQTNRLDSLKEVLKKQINDTNKVQTLISISDAYEIVSDYNESFNYAEQALKLSKSLKYDIGIIGSMQGIASLHFRKGDYPISLKKYNESLKLSEDKSYSIGMYNALNRIGSIFFFQSNYDLALKNYEQAIKIAEKTNYKFGIANTKQNVGALYYKQISPDYSKSLSYLSEALEIFTQLNDTRGKSFCYNNIANVYDAQSNYSAALKNYLAALEIKKQFNNKHGIAFSSIEVATTYLKLKDYAKTKKYLEDGLKIAKEIGERELIKNAYNGLTDLNVDIKNWKGAFETNKLFIAYRDSLVNEESTKIISELEFEKKEAGLKAEQDKKEAIYKTEKGKKELELKNQKLIRNGFIIGVVFLLILMFFIYKNLNQSKAANKIISNQKLEVEKQKDIIQQKQTEILSSIQYAKRIQDAFLPQQKFIERKLKDLNKS